MSSIPVGIYIITVVKGAPTRSLRPEMDEFKLTGCGIAGATKLARMLRPDADSITVEPVFPEELL